MAGFESWRGRFCSNPPTTWRDAGLERAGREASPTAAVIDSQSVKAPQAGTRRYDAGKSDASGHIAVDTDGRLVVVNLTPADISVPALRRSWMVSASAGPG
ncbi:hypothetical protein X769_32690 [Mesorhizobium sp. LSJC268A00]|nr:hypothetical protein X769_32690 [Mesorhizobium sp. LSJC268A00]